MENLKLEDDGKLKTGKVENTCRFSWGWVTPNLNNWELENGEGRIEDICCFNVSDFQFSRIKIGGESEKEE